jgi:hypothetical protein
MGREERVTSYYDVGGVDQSIFTDKSESRVTEKNSTCRIRCRTRVYSPCYAGFTASINILSLVQLLIGQFLIESRASEQALNWWAASALFVNTYFMFDLAINIWVYGVSYILKAKKVLLVEVLC